MVEDIALDPQLIPSTVLLLIPFSYMLWGGFQVEYIVDVQRKANNRTVEEKGRRGSGYLFLQLRSTKV